MKKFIGLFLSIVLVFVCFVMVVHGTEPKTGPETEISAFNLSFNDSVYIKIYAYDIEGSDVKMLVWNEAQENYTLGTEDTLLEPVGSQSIDDKKNQVFDYKGLAAKQMADTVYFRAYAEVDGEIVYSSVKKYSILQYVYDKLGKAMTGTKAIDENLNPLLTDMLTYGASAQKYFNYNTDRLATADFYQVIVVGGLLSDGCDNGMYLTGDKVTLTAAKTNAEGVPFSHWKNSDGTKVGTTTELSVTVGEKNEVYTAVYEEKTEITYTVTFRDWDGTELKKETVKEGESATAPVDPTREGYKFTGWDKKFDHVTSDLTVTAQYESTAPQMIVSQVTANAGDTNVNVTITIKNNPGVLGASFKLTYDSALTLTGSTKGGAWSSLTHTKPGVYTSPCNFGWDGVDVADTSNGIILTLTFDVASTASGACNINISYNNGDIFDDDWNPVAFEVAQGAIIVE